MRAELAFQAVEANRHLGDCPEHVPRSEADLRVFVHDLLFWSHDKDYRTMAAFPSEKLHGYDLHVVRITKSVEPISEKCTCVHAPNFYVGTVLGLRALMCVVFALKQNKLHLRASKQPCVALMWG